MIYADHNATSPLRPEAREAMLGALEIGANPSSVHQAGRNARRALEMARVQIGAAIGASAQDIVFTSGGTEANALALTGLAAQLKGPAKLLISDLEHAAVRDHAFQTGIPVQKVPVLPDGMIDLDALQTTLDRFSDADGLPVLALMLANNETGVIQPVAEAAALVRGAGGLVHCDAVQGLGKIPVNVLMLGVDYLALSAHKCGGPAGVGALWVRPGAPLKPIQLGGGQEKSLRSGTENLAGIAGFGAAAEASVRDLAKMAALAPHRDAMEVRLMEEAGVTVFGGNAARLPNTSCFGWAGFRSETQVMAMDLAGICVSAGAACSSGKVTRSGVLSAMGASDALASASIRTSYGWSSVPGDFHATAEAWLVSKARANVLRSA
ncbi:MAG: cysteine desulfurase family protein [Pseudomonadota bacterium]